MNDNNKPITMFPDIYKIVEDLFSAQSKGICTIFFEVSGHTQGIQVRVFRNSWVPDAIPDFNETIYLDHADSKEQLMAFRGKINAFLSSIDETTFDPNYNKETV